MTTAKEQGRHTAAKLLAAAKISSVVGLPIVATPQGRSVASVSVAPKGMPGADEFNAESQANAEFIVRAWNNHYALLEALEGLLAAEDWFLRETGEHDLQDPISEAVEVARTAISAARGKS